MLAYVPKLALIDGHQVRMLALAGVLMETDLMCFIARIPFNKRPDAPNGPMRTAHTPGARPFTAKISWSDLQAVP